MEDIRRGRPWNLRPIGNSLIGKLRRDSLHRKYIVAYVTALTGFEGDHLAQRLGPH
jgi:hypothetical protein